MSAKQNRESAAAAAVEPAVTDIWEPDVEDSEDFTNSHEEERSMYANDFHDEERTQFQREIMAAGNDARFRTDDDDEEEDEEAGLLDTRTLIANNQGKLFICAVCLYSWV